MITLGLAGGLDPVHEARLDAPENFTYDGAAVLVEDGEVVAAIEEARLNRIRHSNKFPFQAIRFCLQQRGLRLDQVDRIAYYAAEEAANLLLSRMFVARPDIGPRMDARNLFAATLDRGLGVHVDPTRLRFYDHKLTHAAGAIAQSGFDESLVLVLDNSGGLFHGRRDASGTVQMNELVAIPSAKSLTRFCQMLLPFLGLGFLEENRATTMAPLGDPAPYRPLLQNLYDLLPGGDYSLHLDRVAQLIGVVEPRPQAQEPGQQHRDLAASLQESLEEIVLHVLRHHASATGLRTLCMAGGIVQNSATNGRVLRSELFDQVFVHPAAHDAGCALGAALLASEEAGWPSPVGRIHHVYWGTDAGGGGRVSAELERWNGFLELEHAPDVVRRTAELLAGGAVVGWVQGRSEFAPRSLGNRSVLADPRVAENRARVEKALRRPHGSAPLVPSIPQEDARTLFDLPAGVDRLPYTAFSVLVRPEARVSLAAAIEADGTAWVQTVERDVNPRFWGLLQAFGDLTGVAALLNTSFNNGDEPIVDSVEDAVVSFLTTDLDYLVVGDHVARRRTPSREDRLSLWVSLPPYVKLQRTRGYVSPERVGEATHIRTSYDAQVSLPLSPALCDLLMGLDGKRSLGDLLRTGGVSDGAEEPLLKELDDLWSRRLVVMSAPTKDGRSRVISAAPSPAGASAPPTPTFQEQLDASAAALEEALAIGNLRHFYRVFRSTELPLLCVAHEGDTNGLFERCFEVLHRLGGISPATALAVENHYYVSSAIATYPTDSDSTLRAKRNALLSAIARERLLVANTNSRVHGGKRGQMGTVARREGDGFRISGQSAFTSLATEGDILVLLTQIEDEGLAVFAVSPMQGNPGVEVGPYVFPTAMLDSDTRQIVFRDLFVPEESRIAGGRGEHPESLFAFEMAWHQLLIPALYLGAAARAIEEVRVFLRATLGRDDQPLSTLDGMVVDVGRLALDYRAACCVLRQAGRALGDVQRLPRDVALLERAVDLASAAKYVGTRCAEAVVGAARRIVGTRSFVGGHPLERLSQEVVFGSLGPEVSAVIERRYGGQVLDERSFLDRGW